MENELETYTILANNYFLTTIESTSAPQACSLAVKIVLQSYEAGEFSPKTTDVDVVAYVSDPNHSFWLNVDLASGIVK